MSESRHDDSKKERNFKVGEYGVDRFLSFATHEGVDGAGFASYAESRQQTRVQFATERSQPSANWSTPPSPTPTSTNDTKRQAKAQKRATNQLNTLKNALLNDPGNVKFITEKDENGNDIIYAKYRFKKYNIDEILKNADYSKVDLNRKQCTKYKKNLFNRILSKQYSSCQSFHRGRVESNNTQDVEVKLGKVYENNMKNYLVKPRFELQNELETPKIEGVINLQFSSEGIKYLAAGMTEPAIILWDQLSDQLPSDFPIDMPAKDLYNHYNSQQNGRITELIYSISDIIMETAHNNNHVTDTELATYKKEKDNIENLRQLPIELQANINQYSSAYYSCMNGLMRNGSTSQNRNPPISIDNGVICITADEQFDQNSNDTITMLEGLSTKHNNNPILIKKDNTVYLYRYIPGLSWGIESLKYDDFKNVKFPAAKEVPTILNSDSNVISIVNQHHQRGHVRDVLLDVLASVATINQYGKVSDKNVRGDFNMSTSLLDKKEQSHFQERGLFSTAAGKSTYVTKDKYQDSTTSALSLVEGGMGLFIDPLNEKTALDILFEQGHDAKREFEILSLPGVKQNELLYKKTYELQPLNSDGNQTIRTGIFYVSMNEGDLNYKVKNPKGKIVDGVIKRDELQGLIGADAKIDPTNFDPQQLLPYMTKILDFTAKKKHTYAEIHVLKTTNLDPLAQNQSSNESTTPINDNLIEPEVEINPPEVTIQLDEKDQFDVVISGGGPVALASALEAIKLGKRVAIISDRDIDVSPEDQKHVFSRGQRIFLDEQSRYQLLKQFPSNFRENPDDVKFFNQLTNEITIRVRDIERFQFRRINELRQNDPSVIEFINRKEVKNINLDLGIVEIGGSRKDPDAPPRKLSFTHMIGADGARHHSADMMNKSLNEQDRIHYNKIPAPKHPYHAAITVNIKLSKSIRLPETQFIEVATKYEDKTYVSGISLNKKKSSGNDSSHVLKCVFGGEIPKELFDRIQEHNNYAKPADDSTKQQIKQEVIAHMKKVLADELGVDPSEFEIDFPESKSSNDHAYDTYQKSKSTLHLQAFETSLIKADKACLKKNGHQFVLAGDAYRRPNYQFGHGLNHAFKHSKFIGELVGGKIDTDEYNKRCDQLSREIEVPNSFLNKIGKQGTKLLIKAGNERPERVRRQFSGLKNPNIAEIIAPINQYAANPPLLFRHKSSANRLLNDIKKSDQRPWDVYQLIDTELYRVKNHALPHIIKNDQYLVALELARNEALKAHLCDMNLQELFKNEDLLNRIQGLIDHMKEGNHTNFLMLAEAISKQDNALLENHCQLIQAQHQTRTRREGHRDESDLTTDLANIFARNADGKFKNSKVFMEEISSIVLGIEKIRDKNMEAGNKQVDDMYAVDQMDQRSNESSIPANDNKFKPESKHVGNNAKSSLPSVTSAVRSFKHIAIKHRIATIERKLQDPNLDTERLRRLKEKVEALKAEVSPPNVSSDSKSNKSYSTFTEELQALDGKIDERIKAMEKSVHRSTLSG